MCVVAVPKGEPGEHWRRLFRGDSDGARCIQPPYTLSGAAQWYLAGHMAADVRLQSSGTSDSCY